MILYLEPYRRPRHLCRTGVRGHDQDDISKIRAAAIVVGQTAMIHDLKKQVKDIGMRFLNLVKKQDTMRMLGNCLG